MPDALSKTIPIWCCVLNRALFPDRPESHNLYVPPNAISDSEKSQAAARIPEGLASLKQLNLDLAGLRSQVSKPLRPTWLTQETDLHRYPTADSQPIFDGFRPVICCTASRRVADGEMSGHAGYVQGAGDDTENWAHGLEPPVFWAHADRLLSTPEAELPDLIRSLVAASARPPPLTGMAAGTDASGLPAAVRQLAPYLYVSPLPLPQALLDDPRWCTIALSSTPTPAETWVGSSSYMEVGLGKHKVASRNLRVALANICEFVARFLQTGSKPGDQPGGLLQEQKRILVACETGGRDISVGVALALLCWCFEDDEGKTIRNADGGGPGQDRGQVSFNKTLIKIRLGRIMTAMPDANPNRATLQSVNSFLMDWRK